MIVEGASMSQEDNEGCLKGIINLVFCLWLFDLAWDVLFGSDD